MSASLVTAKRALGAMMLWLSLTTLGCDDGRTPLVLYSPHGRDLLTLVETRFEQLHPEIDVRWLDMGSQEVFDRVRSEAANPQCDVWFGGPDTILARGAEAGLLASFRPAWADAVPPESRDAQNRFFGLYRTPPVIVYNEAAVTEAEAPTRWDDLLLPQWKDKVIVRDPLASGTMRTIFGMIVARTVAAGGSVDDGFDWLMKLDSQTKEYVQNPALLHTKIIRQEGLVTLWELTDILFQRQRGAPLGYRFPLDGTLVIDDSIGLVAGGPQPQAAQLFIDWVGGREAALLAAEQAYRLPARTDLASELPEWAREAQRQLVPAVLDRELVAAHDVEWMVRWDRSVRGRGAK